MLDDLNRRSSWHFTIGYDRVEQHYPVSMNCWHGGDADDDGGVRANIDLVGIEHLGLAGQPLTPYQVDMTIRLTRWLQTQRRFTEVTRSSFAQWPVWRLKEHNEVSDVPTTCPSNRIPWGIVVPALNQTEVRVKYTDAVLDQVFGAILPQLGKALATGNAAAAAVIDHVATHPGGGGTVTQMAELSALRTMVAEHQASLADLEAKLVAIAEAANG